MKTIKFIYNLVVVACMFAFAVSFTSCGDDDEDETEATTSAATPINQSAVSGTVDIEIAHTDNEHGIRFTMKKADALSMADELINAENDTTMFFQFDERINYIQPTPFVIYEDGTRNYDLPFEINAFKDGCNHSAGIDRFNNISKSNGNVCFGSSLQYATKGYYAPYGWYTVHEMPLDEFIKLVDSIR